jgi:molecular chaperone GrpE
MDREGILRRFEAWLDDVLTAEEGPQGIAAEILSRLDAEGAAADGQFDLYSMWSAITALTQEVKLQGRTFKQLSETVAPVAEMAPTIREIEGEAQARPYREMLDVFLDLRDRFVRGLETARASLARLEESSSQGGWREKLLGYGKLLKPALETTVALEKGYSLCLDRLDEVLGRLDLSEIVCQNQPFDPASMEAVDLEKTSRVPDGTVLEVYRAGYDWKGETYRRAQVKVSRSPEAVLEREEE